MVSQGSSARSRSDALLPPAYRAAVRTVRPLMQTFTRRDWQGAENLPEGGCVVCVNHISHGDPLAVAHFLYDSGHPAFFLAKASLFEIPVIGRWIGACEQVPVYRGDGTRAIEALRDAVSAVRAGRCVVIMPESTITKDPLGWPMTGKTGAARVAFETGAPVLPLAQWGAQEVRHPTEGQRWRRAVMRMRLGPPVDLDDLRARPVDAEVLREATTRIMSAITAGVEELRGEPAPSGTFDPRTGNRLPPATDSGARRGEAGLPDRPDDRQDSTDA